MNRRVTAYLLMFCLLWQAMSCAGAAVLMASPSEKLHASLHFEGASHHHAAHDHGELQLDDSQASTQHLIDDACVHAPALLPLVAKLLPGLGLVAPSTPLPIAAPLPFLAGLERPPRHDS